MGKNIIIIKENDIKNQRGKFMEEKIIHWGILATGVIAKKFALTLSEMEKMGETVKLTAVASRTEEAAKKFAEEYGAVRYYGSYEEMVKDSEIDVVYIATPNNMHYENVLLCLNGGKHVLCEKPFTLNKKDAEILFQTAREKNLFIMEAFWIRHLPVLKELQKIIRQKKIGSIKHVRLEYGFISQGSRRERKFNPSRCV